MNEMGLFRDWLLYRHLAMQLEESEQQVLQQAFDLLAEDALSQPRVCVHRDYHSRNLMRAEQHNPGILDYQDAVIGPLTYDLVSLLRDCYIAWPRQRVEDWALGYYELALQCGVFRPDEADEHLFLRWFDWMGVQRHLKAAGIFARLNHRDDKPGYLQDIPRTLAYVVDVCGRYRELAGLGGIVQRVTDRLSV
jgi:aminoglycoside/choline kinase family phosphotransferase